MGLSRQAVANALKEGAGIIQDERFNWHIYRKKPEWALNEGRYRMAYHICELKLEIDYSGHWRQSWTPKQEYCKKSVYVGGQDYGKKCNKPLPCTDHTEKPKPIPIAYDIGARFCDECGNTLPCPDHSYHISTSDKDACEYAPWTAETLGAMRIRRKKWTYEHEWTSVIGVCTTAVQVAVRGELEWMDWQELLDNWETYPDKRRCGIKK